MAVKHSVGHLFAGKAEIDSKVKVQGWVKTRRDSKAGISFVQLHDGSSFAALQLVVPNTLENYSDEILKLTAGCSIEAVGTLVQSQGKGQSFEIQVDSLTVAGWVENPESYPISAKRHSLEYLRNVAHLRVRTNTISAVCRIRHRLAQAIHQFFSNDDFYWIHTPIITSSDCEGAGEMFRVSNLDLQRLPLTDNGKIDFSKDFFGKETFLTVSGQLNVESYCMAMSKVYTFGPTFRAENSNTSRHLAEFWMVEPEVAFADLNDMCTLSENLLKHVIKDVLDNCQEDLKFFNQFIDKGCLERLETLTTASFEQLDYTDAVDMLLKSKQSFEYPVKWGIDLQSEHERYLSETVFKKPVIIKNYPKDIKGFYMRMNDDNKTVAAMDVLVPGIGELIGGSQRKERLSVLEGRMDECNIDKEHYSWYLDLRRYGTVPHSGFGMGFERLISYVTGLSNVRDVIPFPRTPGNADY